MEINLKDIFENDENLYLIPPYLSENIQNRIISYWQSLNLNNSVFLLSSGTSSKEDIIKSYVISKQSILENAKNVNRRFNFNSEDIWLSSLPKHHIGGFSILARAFLSKSRVIEVSYMKWDASSFVNDLKKFLISVCSLVPTQLFDITEQNLMAPKGLRAVFIGGDYLDNVLALKAIRLGWPIIVTYGMTENSSQIASSFYHDLEEDHIELLPGVKIIEDSNGFYLESNSLYSEYIEFGKNKVLRMKRSKNFYLSDEISLINKEKKQFIRPLGRKDGVIKIKGRLYYFNDLKNICYKCFHKLKIFNMVDVQLVDDLREGKCLKLYYLDHLEPRLAQILDEINYTLPGPIQVKLTKKLGKFNKSELGKLKSIQ